MKLALSSGVRGRIFLAVLDNSDLRLVPKFDVDPGCHSGGERYCTAVVRRAPHGLLLRVGQIECIWTEETLFLEKARFPSNLVLEIKYSSTWPIQSAASSHCRGPGAAVLAHTNSRSVRLDTCDTRNIAWSCFR